MHNMHNMLARCLVACRAARTWSLVSTRCISELPANSTSAINPPPQQNVVQQSAQAVTLPERPCEPGPTECCQSGCPNCVWTQYEADLQAWTQLAEQLGVNPADHSPAGAPSGNENPNSMRASMSAFEAMEAELARKQQQQPNPLRASMSAFEAMEAELARKQQQQQQQPNPMRASMSAFEAMEAELARKERERQQQGQQQSEQSSSSQQPQ